MTFIVDQQTTSPKVNKIHIPSMNIAYTCIKNKLKQKRCNNVKACLVEQCIDDIAVNTEPVSPSADSTVSNNISQSSPLILTRQ